MSAAIIDASVGVKWFVPEIHAAEARCWCNGPDELHVPAFFFDLEIANILWKKVRRAEITRADADQILVKRQVEQMTALADEDKKAGIRVADVLRKRKLWASRKDHAPRRRVEGGRGPQARSPTGAGAAFKSREPEVRAELVRAAKGE